MYVIPLGFLLLIILPLAFIHYLVNRNTFLSRDLNEVQFLLSCKGSGRPDSHCAEVIAITIEYDHVWCRLEFF